MHGESDRTTFLEDAIEQVLSRGELAVDELCRLRPEFADALRRKVRTLQDLGLLGGMADAPMRTLGRYRLLELLGRGGMGAVYVAERTDLGRRVALKLIRGEQLLFAGARERFQREIETIARLQVPGVVPILDVGAADGVPFYAMELLPGVDLAQLLRARRSDAARPIEQLIRAGSGDGSNTAERGFFEGGVHRVAARIAVRLARTMARVHEHGIVHRDIKPSNVMIDRDGRVTVVDFGLAHLADAADLTRTGALLGSLPYMAPEQLRSDGASVGTRSDVYGIGITLHELVYGEPAFVGDQVELVERIPAGRRPRRNGPRDLEVIIARATDPDPSRRYGTADELADDLERFLEFRPILARPSGVWLRALRWGQRNRVVAIAAIAAGVLAVAIPTAVAIERSHALEQVRGERDKYERTIVGVVDVLGEAQPLLAEVASRDGGRTASRIGELFRSMSDFYAELRRFDPERSAIRRSLVVAQFREAELLARFGEGERATELSDGVLQLTDGERGASTMRYELRMIRGELFEARGEAERAAAEWRAAIAELDGNTGGGFDDRLRAARCRLSLANMLTRRYDDEQVPAAQRAIEAFEQLLQEQPDHVESLSYLSKARRVAAQGMTRTGSVEAGFALLLETRRDIAAALERHPHDHMLENELSITEHVLGQESRAAGRHAEAVPHLEQAVRLRRRFRERWPERPNVTRDLADSLADLGSSRNICGLLEPAADALAEARTLLEQQLERTPEAVVMRRLLVDVYMESGSNLRRRGERPEQAHELIERAVALIQELIDEQDDVRFEDYGQRAAACATCGQSHLMAGRKPEGLAMLQRARGDMRRFAERGDPLMKRQLGQVCLLASRVAAELGRIDTVEELLREADTMLGFTADDVGFLGASLGEQPAAELLRRLGK